MLDVHLAMTMRDLEQPRGERGQGKAQRALHRRRCLRKVLNRGDDSRECCQVDITLGTTKVERSQCRELKFFSSCERITNHECESIAHFFQNNKEKEKSWKAERSKDGQKTPLCKSTFFIRLTNRESFVIRD